MSLLFNTLSRFVIAFLPRSKRFLISWLQPQYTVSLEPKKRKSVTTSTFSPSICHEVVGLDVIILVFKIFNFKLALSLSSFSLIKRLFSFSLLSVVRVVSSMYLKLLMFLPPIFSPACNLSSLAFLMMCSMYRLNKQQQTALLYSFLNLEPVSCSIQGSDCCFLTHIQFSQETGKMVWCSHLFKNLPHFIMIPTAKDFGIIDETQR